MAIYDLRAGVAASVRLRKACARSGEGQCQGASELLGGNRGLVRKQFVTHALVRPALAPTLVTPLHFILIARAIYQDTRDKLRALASAWSAGDEFENIIRFVSSRYFNSQVAPSTIRSSTAWA